LDAVIVVATAVVAVVATVAGGGGGGDVGSEVAIAAAVFRARFAAADLPVAALAAVATVDLAPRVVLELADARIALAETGDFLPFVVAETGASNGSSSSAAVAAGGTTNPGRDATDLILRVDARIGGVLAIIPLATAVASGIGGAVAVAGDACVLI
jgi:hypothetical protein